MTDISKLSDQEQIEVYKNKILFSKWWSRWTVIGMILIVPIFFFIIIQYNALEILTGYRYSPSVWMILFVIIEIILFIILILIKREQNQNIIEFNLLKKKISEQINPENQ